MLLDDIEIFKTTYEKINNVMSAHEGENISISYSGGADSDTIMWLIRNLGYSVKGIFSNTGIEYQATLDHIEYMKSLGFEIITIRPEHSIYYAQKEYGKPFISKNVSSMIERLQKNGFDFINDANVPFEELLKKYPKTISGVKWFANEYFSDRYKILWNKGLKEFLIENGTPFSISDKCCKIVKKNPIDKYVIENNISLVMMGIRRAEGGRRSNAYESCYRPKTRGYSHAIFMPIFYWKDADKKLYDETFNIKHSACYTEYGLQRTGCAGCPFARKFEEELAIIEKYEPKLYKAVSSIFSDSYEFTRKYRDFVSSNTFPTSTLKIFHGKKSKDNTKLPLDKS